MRVLNITGYHFFRVEINVKKTDVTAKHGRDNKHLCNLWIKIAGVIDIVPKVYVLCLLFRGGVILWWKTGDMYS